jgi:mannose-6-phosphate isomerase-like protein (cupin superfamily)
MHETLLQLVRRLTDVRQPSLSHVRPQASHPYETGVAFPKLPHVALLHRNRCSVRPGAAGSSCAGAAGLRSSALAVDLEDEMSRTHTQINLADVEDAAPAGGFGDRWEARVARVDLKAEQTGVTHFRLRPGKRSPFAHRHARAEEVYVILAGSGRVKLDNEIADVRVLDAIRIAPEVVRAFEAGPDGLEFLVFGPHYEADGEQVDDAWVE